MADQKEITGKKRIVVDKSAFLDLVRNAEGQIATSNIQHLTNVYLPYDGVDTVRVALGKYWDHELSADIFLTKYSGESKIFNSGNPAPHPPIDVFCGSPLELVDCGPEELIQEGEILSGFKQKAVLKCEVTQELFKEAFSSLVDNPLTQVFNHQHFWAYLMKYGVVTEDGFSYTPIIKTGMPFYDHYHEAIAPYTLAELDSEQPVGKAFFVDYKTYYNNRASSIKYENFIAGSLYQNSLPNIYAFVKIINNQELIDNQFFAFHEIVYGPEDPVVPGVALKQFYDWSGSPRPDLPVGMFVVPSSPQTYTSLFQHYPLEASLLLYGAPGIMDNTPKPERLLKLDAKKTDASALFSAYIENYRNVLEEDEVFYAYPGSTSAGRTGIDPLTKLGAIEYINSNLVLSPGAITTLKKAGQYKDYFPMYFEMNFTAQLSTLIGDEMKKFKLTKFLANEVAATQTIFGNLSEPIYPNFSQDNSIFYPFVDYIQKDLYENLNDPDFVELPMMNEPVYSINSKKAINLINEEETGAVDKWLSGENYSSVNNHLEVESWAPDFWLQATDGNRPVTDLRNYVTYIRNDADEPANLDSDCNAFFKSLFGPALRQRLIDIYETKKRTYNDILEGVPAYTEDLFYVIKKYRKDAENIEELNVQNIIIPNTSDLDIVEYIDTQVKYGAHATYRYEAYAYRVVFGSKYIYDYQYTESPTSPINASSVDLLNPTLLPENFFHDITAQAWDHESPETAPDNFIFTTTFDIIIKPSIQLIEDKIFSTPDIRILDNPPVPPYTDIVPYRAVSNKIKIMLNGSTDTYRDTPVIILEEDTQNFNIIKESQFSYDGKVQFSSDDRVSGFQIFRVENKPKSYSDFRLHPSIPQINGAFVAFDDSILPNKKYYYTFRAIDNHGHVSNPTPVYEVELIDEKGAVKPLIRTVSMDVVENKAPMKECQKYILIRPTDKQIYFSDQPDVNNLFSTDDLDNRKRYKMRLTSKGSGKKIDINFSFFKNFKEDQT